jgi:colicin import membrane protein
MTYDDVTSRERRISGALALVMHLMFIALLVFGVSWQKTHTDSAVIVELWNNLPPLPQPKSEPVPPPPPEPPKPLPQAEPKPLPKVEPKPAPKPDIALKEKQEKERKQKDAEKQKELEKLEARKLAEKKAREAALLMKEKEKKEAEARLAREKEEALQRLAQQQSAAQARIMDAYMHGVRERIRRNIVLPPNMPGNPEARFEVVQIPGGEVLSVKLRRSSGVPAYDEAVERAILRASPLPPPPPGVQFSEVRELNLVFRPKE